MSGRRRRLSPAPPSAPSISVRVFVPAAPDLVRRDRLGWLRLEVAGLLVVEDVALRRTRAVGLVLTFPVDHDAQGRQRAIVRPVDADGRCVLEKLVLAALVRERQGRP